MNTRYKIGDFVGYSARENQPVAVPMPRWWAIRKCLPGRDPFVVRALTSRGVCVYSPMIVKSIDRKTGSEARKPHLGRRIATPFLPGLLFVPDFEIDNRFMESDANAIDGLEDWLMFADWRATLSLLEMASLQAIVASLNVPKTGRFHRGQYRIGDRVAIVDGPFAQFAARIDRLDSRGRLRVFIDSLRGVLVSLSETQVRPDE